jgi:hypothetical protein
MIESESSSNRVLNTFLCYMFDGFREPWEKRITRNLQDEKQST